MKKNVQETIAELKTEAQELEHRYYSFDFCYFHFRSSKERGEDINIEQSCQILWSYLGSWGMLRGSSFLLSKNPAYLKGLVEWIYAQPKSTWEIDVEDYENKSKEILKLYNQINKFLLRGTTTLVTKILLGVFAITPAYDRFFKDTFKEISGNKCSFIKFDESSLMAISKFYKENKEEIDQLSEEHRVINFNGEITNYYYSKAKIIDMYGFQIGRKKLMKRKQNRKKDIK